MSALMVLLCVLLPPQLIDRTKEAAPSLSAQAGLSDETRADIHMARKMYREAIETYEKALVAQPGDYRVYNKLGIAYHHLTKLSEAKRHYQRAIKLNKSSFTRATTSGRSTMPNAGTRRPPRPTAKL